MRFPVSARHFAIALLLAPAFTHAACPDAEAVKTYLADFEARRPNSTFSNALSLDDAKCARRKLIDALSVSHGPIIGYKAAFTNDLLRGMFRFDRPAWGVVYGKYLHQSPAKVPLKYGAVTYWDADLLVEVKDAGLADAKTPLEALRHLSAVIPFLGLKDLMSSDNESFEHFTAINTGFRSGVLGARIPVQPTRKFLNSLGKITVETTENGQVVTRAKDGVFLDGGPVNAVMWLARALRENGIVLKKGDLLGVGGFTMGQSPRRDVAVNVKYVGLPGDPSVALQFD